MSFWDLSDGGSAKDTGTEYEVPGGNMDPIPNDSSVLAQIEEVKWTTKGEGADAVRYVEARWSVLEPAEYANRKVFHKLWVNDLDPAAKSEDKAIQKRDKARRMLAGIDANAGGKLMASPDAPTDDSMALALCNRPMVIKLMLWEMPDRERYGEFIRGNWVAAVSPKGGAIKIGAEKPKPSGAGAGGRPSSQSTGGGFDLDGDDIPFSPEVRV